MDSESTARVIDMPHVKAAKDEAAKAKVRRAKVKAVVEADVPEVVFSSVSEAARAAIESWESAQRAREARTAVGKRFADRVKSANEKLAAAVTDNPKNAAAKLAVALDSAKARARKLRTEFEELATDDKGPVGKAFRSRARVLEERAEEKAKAGEKVTKRGARFEAVMASIKAQSAQLKLAL